MTLDPKPEDWAVLGLSVGCSRAEAHAAFVHRAMTLHPDAHPGATAAERERLTQAMAKLNQAWDRIEAADPWAPRPPPPPPPPPPPRPRARRTRPPRLAPPPPGLVRILLGHGARGDGPRGLVGSSEDLLGLAAVEGAPYVLLRCTDVPLQDEHLAALRALPSLRTLDLDGTGVGDGALAVLAHLPELRDLRLSDTRVTDAALPAIAQLPRLRSLSLVGTAVTDAGLASLAGHPTLTVLNVRGTGVHGPGLAALRSCPSLSLLALSHVDRHDRRDLARSRPDLTFA